MKPTVLLAGSVPAISATYPDTDQTSDGAIGIKVAVSMRSVVAVLDVVKLNRISTKLSAIPVLVSMPVLTIDVAPKPPPSDQLVGKTPPDPSVPTTAPSPLGL